MLISENTYILNGIINGSGKFTSFGISEFTRDLFQATFIGSGHSHRLKPGFTLVRDHKRDGHLLGTRHVQRTYGQSGSFHIVDALPGEYALSVDFGRDGGVNSTIQNSTILNRYRVPSFDLEAQ